MLEHWTLPDGHTAFWPASPAGPFEPDGPGSPAPHVGVFPAGPTSPMYTTDDALNTVVTGILANCAMLADVANNAFDALGWVVVIL